MGYYDNPVDAPEDYGFTFVVQRDFAEPNYGFDVFAVLKNEQGYYLSTDSGCSCPSPWESHTVEDFTGPLTAEQVHEEVRSLWNHAYYPVAEKDITDALALVV